MIYNVATKQWVDCYYRQLGKKELGKYGPPKWVFNFKKDYAENYKVFSLETKEYPGEVQASLH